MKGDAETVFVPSHDEDEDEAPESTEKPKKASSGPSTYDTTGATKVAEHDELLGNAFDAFSDGDREGFVRSMRAALRAMKR